MKAKQATQSAVKERRCSPTEEHFAQLIAAGRLGTQAYRIAWGGSPSLRNADSHAARVMKRAHVVARIEEIRREISAKLQTQGVISTRERRELLAQTARSVKASLKATHGERIRALELDARLAGDLSDKVEVTGELDVRACVLALMGAGVDVPVPVPGPVVASSNGNGNGHHTNGNGNGHGPADEFSDVPLPDIEGPVLIDEEEEN